MGKTIRNEKNPNRKLRTPHVRSKMVALSICDCGNAISDGSILCLECEITLEAFDGFTPEELDILGSQLNALEEVAG